MAYIRTHPDLTFPPRIPGDSRQLRRWEKDLTFCQEEEGKKMCFVFQGLSVQNSTQTAAYWMEGKKKKKLNTL